jgi:O-antigen ligase
MRQSWGLYLYLTFLVLITLNIKTINLELLVAKKNFLLLAIMVGFVGIGLGIFTMFSSINNIIQP